MSPVAVVDLAFDAAAWVLVFRFDITADVGNSSSIFFVDNVVDFRCTIDKFRVARLDSLNVNMKQVSLLESIINKLFDVKAKSFIVVNHGPSRASRNIVTIFTLSEEEKLNGVEVSSGSRVSQADCGDEVSSGVSKHF